MKRPGIINILVIVITLFSMQSLFSQAVPAEDENIPYVVTFGGDSEHSWGDDDFSQIFFFLVPDSYTEPFYIRIYDPDTGGELDELKGESLLPVTFTDPLEEILHAGAGSGPDPLGHDWHAWGRASIFREPGARAEE